MRANRRAGLASVVAGCRWVLTTTVLLVLGAMPVPAFAQCSEEPAVLMDERTAETHLLSKKDPELPTLAPGLARVREVVVLVTVDREGVICEVKAVRGPKALRKKAVETVKKHWRYRPFLVNWKPVVAKFPVTVKFAIPKQEPRAVAAAFDGSALRARAAI